MEALHDCEKNLVSHEGKYFYNKKIKKTWKNIKKIDAAPVTVDYIYKIKWTWYLGILGIFIKRA